MPMYVSCGGVVHGRKEQKKVHPFVPIVDEMAHTCVYMLSEWLMQYNYSEITFDGCCCFTSLFYFAHM
jgi:hypothetical protein